VEKPALSTLKPPQKTAFNNEYNGKLESAQKAEFLVDPKTIPAYRNKRWTSTSVDVHAFAILTTCCDLDL